MQQNHKIDLIKDVVHEFWEHGAPQAKGREISLDLKTDLINDVVGVRRSGKTYLMFLTMADLMKSLERKRIIYLNLEDRRLPPDGWVLNALVEFIQAEGLLGMGKVYLFLDEVQRIEGWERYLRSIQDEFKGRIKIFVSGSSRSLLGREYARLLTGRHLTTVVFPLSFEEFLSFKGFDTGKEHFTGADRARIGMLLEEYLRFGGFPEVVLSGEKERLLGQLLHDILVHDVLERVSLKKSRILEEVAYFLCGNAASLISFSKLCRFLGSMGVRISVPTLQAYFGYLRDAFLLFDLPIFSYSAKDQLQYPRKVYCIDTGLVHVAGRMGEMSRLFENAVAVELLRRTSGVPAACLHYWKDRTGREVDFVVREGGKVKELIQACYSVSSVEVKEREVGALVKAAEEFELEGGKVITLEFEGEETRRGKLIEFVPLWKWPLKK